MKAPKIYTSAKGKKFSIVGISKPRDKDGVIFLTRDEWEWIKEQDLDTEQFELLLQFKIEDHHHEIITDEVVLKKKALAIKHCTEIRAMLLGGIKSESKSETKNEELCIAPGKLPEGGEGHDRIKTWVDRTSGEERPGEDINIDRLIGSPAGEK